MRRSVFLIIFMIVGLEVFAQLRVPDRSEVLESTIDASSHYYYPNLFARYMAGDSTLTQDDYFYLYYGYANQDSYKPLEADPANDQILEVLSRSENHDKMDAQIILKYAKEVMAHDPFSPSNLNFMAYAYNILGDTVNERLYADRVASVLKVIESSGLGNRESSPWHILMFSHATDLLATKGEEIAKREIVSKTVEYVVLKNREPKVKGHYFDFSRIYWNKPKNLDSNRQKRVDGVEFNGIKIKNK